MNKTLMQKIRENINKPVGTIILTAALLGGCRANYKEPTYVTKIGSDSIEIYHNPIRAHLMKTFKEDGTEIRYYDNIWGLDGPYVDRIEVKSPDIIRIYRNDCGIKDLYDTIFITATKNWQRAYYKILKIDSIKAESDSALKLIE